MKIPTPSLEQRREAVELVRQFYDEPVQETLDEAVRIITDFYCVPPPAIQWRLKTRLRQRALGLCFQSGTIYLLHPRRWAERVPRGGDEAFLFTLMHEVSHHILWADCETKADALAERLLSNAE